MHKINLAVLSNAATIAQKAICQVTIDQKNKEVHCNFRVIQQEVIR